MLNVGDIVHIRPDIKSGVYYGLFMCNSEMARFAGQCVTIKSVRKVPGASIPYYRIHGMEWNFTDEMFLSFDNYDLPLDDSEFDLSEVLV